MEEFKLKASTQTSIIAFGKFISNPLVRVDVTLLRKSIDLVKKLDLSKVNDVLKSGYYLALSEAYLYCINLSPKHFFDYSNDDIVCHIQYLRRALYYSRKDKVHSLEDVFLINLGCALDNTNRYSEALIYWKSSITSGILKPKDKSLIGTAIGHIGSCELKLATILPRYEQRRLFLIIGGQHILEALSFKELNPRMVNIYRDRFNKVENLYFKESIDDSVLKVVERYTHDPFIKWGLDNVMFLNPLNDVVKADVAADDDVDLNFLNHSEYQNIIPYYNELKEQFDYSRGLLYDSYVQSDDNKAKMCFKLAYSILDKLSVIINILFKFNYRNSALSYNKLWFTKKSNKECLNDLVTQTSNKYLIALYWISRDLFLEGQESSDPEANDIAKCRNYIEHRFVKVVDEDILFEENNQTQLVVGRNVLYKKNLKLHSLVRNALIYFYLAAFEEKDSHHDK